MTAEMFEYDDDPQPRKGPGPDPRVFRWLPARSLVIDKRTQREVLLETWMPIAQEFDWRYFEALTVVDNGNGTYSVVEGQHRTMAAQYLNGDMLLPCMVMPTLLTETVRAEVALRITNGRRKHSAYDKWQLRLEAGHPHEVLATDVMRRHDIRLGRAPSSRTIAAASTLTRIVHGGGFTPEQGAELLDGVLGILIDAWPGYDRESNVNRWDHQLMTCVSTVLARNPDVIRDRLIRDLRIRPAIQWVSIGKGPDALPPWRSMYDTLVTSYNKGLRKGRLA